MNRKGQGRKTAIPRINPAAFEKVIDALDFPLERDEVRQLLIIVCQESNVRTFDGEGLLRKYRRRTPVEIVDATFLRVVRAR